MEILDFKKPDNNTINFTIKNINLTLVNALRRIILSEIPSLAFDTDDIENPDIVIEKNTSSIHNEFLQHRIGLIPIHIKGEQLLSYKKDKYNFILDIINNTNDSLDVTTEHIQVFDNETNSLLSESELRKIFPKNPLTGEFILLNILKPNKSNSNIGEELKINAKASVNTAKKNSKWCVVSESSFSNLIDTEIAEKKLNEILDESEDKTTENLKRIRDNFYNHEAYRYFVKDKLDNPIAFNIVVESIGVMEPVDIYLESFEILENKLNDFIKNMNDEHSDNVKIIKGDTLSESYDIIIKNENDTLGNLLQTYMYNLFNNKKIKFSGYKIPHPLIKEVVVRIALIDDNDNIDDLKNILIECVENIKNDIQVYQNLLSEYK